MVNKWQMAGDKWYKVIGVVHFVPEEFQIDGFVEDDKVLVRSVGDSYLCVIPSFDVLNRSSRTDKKVR